MLRRFGSLKTSVVLLALLFFVVLLGTLGQATWGAAAVQTTLFGRAFFETQGYWLPGLPLLLALLGVNLLAAAWLHLERSWRSLGLWGLHLSLVLFCWGSFGFALAQDELVLGLVPGASSNEAFVRGDLSGGTRPLPFSLKVDSFQIQYYPGSHEPSDYVSVVEVMTGTQQVRGEIQMNRPLRVDGWTIYQSSVQAVEGRVSPVFKLVNNPAGAFPYLVFGLLLASLLWHSLLGRRSKVSHE